MRHAVGATKLIANTILEREGHHLYAFVWRAIPLVTIKLELKIGGRPCHNVNVDAKTSALRSHSMFIVVATCIVFKSME